MRKGQSFDESVTAMIHDLPWQSEQAAVFRQEYPEPNRPNRSRSRDRSRERKRRRRSRSQKRGGKGGGKDKGKGKKGRVDTSQWLTESNGSQICRNYNLSLCGRTQCSRVHVCAICQGNHRATDRAHH